MKHIKQESFTIYICNVNSCKGTVKVRNLAVKLTLFDGYGMTNILISENFSL
jgi:hypothetical protein